jgi:hypothetical protein
VNPNRAFEGWALKKSHSLRQCLSKPLLDETPKKKVGSRKEKDDCQKDVIDQKDHKNVKAW